MKLARTYSMHLQEKPFTQFPMRFHSWTPASVEHGPQWCLEGLRIDPRQAESYHRNAETAPGCVSLAMNRSRGTNQRTKKEEKAYIDSSKHLRQGIPVDLARCNKVSLHSPALMVDKSLQNVSRCFCWNLRCCEKDSKLHQLLFPHTGFAWHSKLQNR